MLKFTRQGKFLLQVGREGQSKGNTDTANLNRAAEAEVDLAANEVYVADGYGNRRVIVFDADTGAYKRHWGAYGKKPDDTDPPVRSGSADSAGVPHGALRADCQRRARVRVRSRQRPHPGVQKRRDLREGNAGCEGHARRRRHLRHGVLERQAAAASFHRRRREPSRVDAAARFAPGSQPFRQRRAVSRAVLRRAQHLARLEGQCLYSRDVRRQASAEVQLQRDRVGTQRRRIKLTP